MVHAQNDRIQKQCYDYRIDHLRQNDMHKIITEIKFRAQQEQNNIAGQSVKKNRCTKSG